MDPKTLCANHKPKNPIFEFLLHMIELEAPVHVAGAAKTFVFVAVALAVSGISLSRGSPCNDSLHFLAQAQDSQDKPTKTPPRQFSLAKHRFESSYVPLMQLVLYFPAFVLAAQQLLRERTGDDKVCRQCRKFLSALTEENLLAISMLGDASGVVMRFTRFLDKETYDASKLGLEALECTNSLQHLFVEGAVTEHGLTLHMMKRLQTPLVWTDEKGIPCSVGGCNSRIEKSLQQLKPRFTAFTKLCFVTMLTEFPCFHQLMALACFRLGCKGAVRTPRKQQLESIERMARLCKVDTRELTEQLEDRAGRSVCSHHQ